MAHARRQIPPLSGVNFSDIEWQDVEQNIKQAVIDFEPRIDSKSLQVIVNTEDDNDDALHNKLIIEIKGHLKLNPYPKEFLLRTSMDIETGLFNLLEGGCASAKGSSIPLVLRMSPRYAWNCSIT